MKKFKLIYYNSKPISKRLSRASPHTAYRCFVIVIGLWTGGHIRVRCKCFTMPTPTAAGGISAAADTEAHELQVGLALGSIINNKVLQRDYICRAIADGRSGERETPRDSL